MIREKGVHASGGVITERDQDLCTVRTRMPAGVLSSDQLRGLADIADRWGDGTLHVTTRQTVEIPHVRALVLEEVAEALERNGTPVGAEREEVVNIVACPGIERCKYANVETIELARRIDEKVFGKQTTIKLRISLSACPYGCTSPQLNEIGIIGRIRPLRIPGLCTGCGTCVEYCRECAISLKNGVSVLDETKCVECGVCIHSCPYSLLKSKLQYYEITIGGHRGRSPKRGRHLIDVAGEDDVVKIIDRIVYWVYRRAWSGRPLGDQMDEIGFEAIKKDIEEEFSSGTGT